MTFYVFVFLFVFCLLLSLARPGRLCWLPLQPSDFKARAVVGPASAPVHPWCEVKSRRGAPKRVNTAGFACPHQQCRYFGNTDAQIHALVGDGKHGQAEQSQTFRCQACRTTFTARRTTPLYRLKTPSRKLAMVRITHWPKGWIRSRCRAGLGLPSGHQHHVADARGLACSDAA